VAEPRAPARTRGPVPIAKKLMLSLVTIVVIVLLLELGVRVFSPGTVSLYVNHAVLGKIYTPGLEKRTYVPECDCEVSLRFNREGARGRDFEYRKPPGVRRIAVLGDSMTAAMATHEENTTVRVLEDLLNASEEGVTWEAMNLGISGSSTAQELVMYREVASKYEPDFALCMFYTGNDFSDNSRNLSSSRHRVYFDLDSTGSLVQLPRSAARARLSTWLNKTSRLYLGEAAHAWRLLERLIQRLQAEVEGDGRQFVMTVLPAAEQVHDDAWEKLLERSGSLRDEMDRYFPEQQLRSICERLEVPLVPMLDEFRAASPHHSSGYESEWLHLLGIGHFNDAGNRLAAEILHRYFESSEAEEAQHRGTD
jgi:hypothetical protein